MGRTINRPITSVNTPSKSDVQNYFFTHANWKGLNNDKNFLTVDQETFSECKNVYMDTEGLLRSRPSMKIKTVKTTLDGEEVVLSDVLECVQFGKVIVYKTKIESQYYLIFAPEDAPAFQAPCEEKTKLLIVEGKIFVFAEGSLNYYDVSTNSYLDGDEFIYIPIIKTYTNGAWEDFEPANELTTSYIYRYLYDNVIDNVDFNILSGKNVRVTIDGNTYYVNFVKGAEVLFLEDIKALNEDNFITIGDYKYPLISPCKTGQFLLSYVKNSELSSANQYDIFYTVDGLIFNKLPDISNVIGFPKISFDGNYAICLKADDLYIYSLTDTTDSDVYKQWTPLIQTKNKEFYDGELQKFGFIPWFNADSIPEMYSIDYFVVYFSWATGYSFRNRAVLICNDGEFKFKFLSLLKSYDEDFDEEDAYLGKFSNFNLNMSSGIEGSILVDLDDITFVKKSDLSTNELVFDFTNVAVEVIRLEDTPTNATFLEHVQCKLKTNIHCYLRKSDGNTYTKFKKDNAIITFVNSESDSEYAYMWADAYLSVNDYDLHFHLNGSSLTSFNTFTLSLYFNSLIDFENDNNSNYVSNLYQHTPNIVYEINNDTFELLIDANCVYKVDAKKEITQLLMSYERDEARCTLQNALYISMGVCKFTKFPRSLLMLYKYDTKLITEHVYIDACSYPLKCIFDENGNLITNKFLYTSEGQKIPMLFETMPLYFNTYFYSYTYKNLYSNNISKTISVDEIIRGENVYIVPDYISEIGNFYLSVGEILYISSYPADGNFKWYLPKISTEQFDYTITNLHPISSTELAVFLDDAIYYIQKADTTTKTGISYYLYYRSKLQVGCKKGADVITSFDGQYVIFPSTRGLVALTYQELTASTEQVLNFLSDGIHKTFSEYNDSAIKLYKYDYWIVCYKENSKALLLFDIRNNSWWPIELCDVIKDIVTIDDKPLILGTNLYYLDSSENNYYDGNTSQIEWSIKSQKLHLSAPNNYKHISNITITSVLDNPSKEALDLDLIVTNYRKRMNTSDAENFVFDVDTVRVYVKRLNYSKVNEFQYELKSDEYNEIRIPLSLSSISIKYKISGQVR